MTASKLDFGCGANKRAGYQGADRLAMPGVDHVFDFDVFPYPFADSSFDAIWCDNVIEHLLSPLRVVEELHRIGKPGASIYVAVPYFRSFYATIDPTHRNFFGVHWFRYFDPGDFMHTKYQYSKATLKTISMHFEREWEGKRSWVRSLLVRLANKRPHAYEARLSHLLPLRTLTWELQVVK